MKLPALLPASNTRLHLPTLSACLPADHLSTQLQPEELSIGLCTAYGPKLILPFNELLSFE